MTFSLLKSKYIYISFFFLFLFFNFKLHTCATGFLFSIVIQNNTKSKSYKEYKDIKNYFSLYLTFITMILSLIFILTFNMEKDDCSTSISSQVAIVHSIQVLYCIPTMFCGRVIPMKINKKIHFSSNVNWLSCINS